MDGKPATRRRALLSLTRRPSESAAHPDGRKAKKLPPPLDATQLRRSSSSFGLRRSTGADGRQASSTTVGEWVRSVKKGVIELRSPRPVNAESHDACVRSPLIRSATTRRASAAAPDSPRRPPLSASGSSCLSSMGSAPSSAGLATPSTSTAHLVPLSTSIGDFVVSAASNADDRKRSVHRRHRSSGNLLMRKASVAFSPTCDSLDVLAPEASSPLVDDDATIRPRKRQLTADCGDLQDLAMVAGRPSSPVRPVRSVFVRSRKPSAAAHPLPFERDSCEGLGFGLSGGDAATAWASASRLPDKADLLPADLSFSVGAFDMSMLQSDRLSHILDTLDALDAEDEPARLGLCQSATSDSLASAASSSGSSGLGTPPLASFTALPDRAIISESSTSPQIDGSRETDGGSKPPLAALPNWGSLDFQPSHANARELKPTIVARGRYRIPSDQSDDPATWGVELAPCSWPLPPPREVWYEKERGTGREVLKSALIDLRTGERA